MEIPSKEKLPKKNLLLCQGHPEVDGPQVGLSSYKLLDLGHGEPLNGLVLEPNDSVLESNSQ